MNAPFSRGSYEIAKLSAGLVKTALEHILKGEFTNAFCLSRPPGHHAKRDFPMGFCHLANIAIAIEAAKANHNLGRVAVVDWDVHHGNGTQDIYYTRPDVLAISIHQENCYPFFSGSVEERGEGPGKGYNLNIPLPPGCGHYAYLHAMETIVLPALRTYQPEFVVVASGLDANGLDPLARMLLSSDSYRIMTQKIIDFVNSQGAKLLVVHEGGYSEAYVPFCGHALVETLCGESTNVEDPFLPIIVAQQPTEKVLKFQCSFIDDLAEKLLGDTF
eukprot:TRINITY_DN15981_c0_g1_i1.p1 TRINITY_DN15981_c0_g1~~TRINITY_DN15981_c0_g1_i1.p1  ORF type:complete len:274 (+),score=42.81 TRINITY_DN15981_c0_g1_i1:400-1221(+)